MLRTSPDSGARRRATPQPSLRRSLRRLVARGHRPKAPVDAGPALAIRRGGGKAMSKDEAKEALKALLEDYYDSVNTEAAVKAITKLMGASAKGWQHKEVPSWVVEVGIDSITPGARPKTGKILIEFTEKGAFRDSEVQTGFHEMLEFFEDMLIDIPKFSEYISEILAEVIITKVVKLDFVATALASTMMTVGDKPACGTDPSEKMPFGQRAAFLAHLVTAMMNASEDADIGTLLADVKIAEDYLAVKDEAKQADQETLWTQHYGFDDIL